MLFLFVLLIYAAVLIYQGLYRRALAVVLFDVLIAIGIFLFHYYADLIYRVLGYG